MKKNLTMLLCLVLAAAMLTGCCSHVWTDATCTAPKTCTECGDTEGQALGHTWQAATCETPDTCTVCGETKGEAPGHSWDGNTCTACGNSRPILEIYPVGQYRFANGEFLFTMEECMALFDAHMELKGVPRMVGELYKLDNHNHSYNVVDPEMPAVTDKGIYLFITEDPISKKVTKVACSYYFSEDETRNDYGMEACLGIVDVCHGAMDDARWDTILSAKPGYSTDSMTTYDIDVDGMNVHIMLFSSSIQITISFE